ncbi:hypothetical protein QJQ45_013716, partial [Haematococcus lacustris]
ANGIKQEYCLSTLGREQVKQAGLLLKEQLSAAPATNPPILILASPFSRTLETARLVAAEVGVDPFGPHFLVRDELVERDFGSDNEGQPYAGRYEAVWAEDQRDSQHPAGSDGESVVNVAERLRALLQVAQPGKGVLRPRLVAMTFPALCDIASDPASRISTDYLPGRNRQPTVGIRRAVAKQSRQRCGPIIPQLASQQLQSGQTC